MSLVPVGGGATYQFDEPPVGAKGEMWVQEPNTEVVATSNSIFNFDENMNYIAVASNNSWIRLYDTQTVSLQWEYSIGHYVTCIDVNNNGEIAWFDNTNSQFKHASNGSLDWSKNMYNTANYGGPNILRYASSWDQIVGIINGTYAHVEILNASDGSRAGFVDAFDNASQHTGCFPVPSEDHIYVQEDRLYVHDHTGGSINSYPPTTEVSSWFSDTGNPEGFFVVNGERWWQQGKEMRNIDTSTTVSTKGHITDKQNAESDYLTLYNADNAILYDEKMIEIRSIRSNENASMYNETIGCDGKFLYFEVYDINNNNESGVIKTSISDDPSIFVSDGNNWILQR